MTHDHSKWFGKLGSNGAGYGLATVTLGHKVGVQSGEEIPSQSSGNALQSHANHPLANGVKAQMRGDLLNRANADYLDRLYDQYQRDPRSLDPAWQTYFAGFDDAGGRAAPRESAPPLTIGVQNLVHSYRELGHFVASLDPLGHDRSSHPLLELSRFGMSDADLDMEVGKADFYGETNGTLRDLIAKLRACYCGTIGVST